MVADAVLLVLALPFRDRVRPPAGRGLAHHLQAPPPQLPGGRRRRRGPCPVPSFKKPSNRNIDEVTHRIVEEEKPKAQDRTVPCGEAKGREAERRARG